MNNIPKAALSIPETTRYLSLGRTTLYGLIKQGHLTPVKCGRRTLVLASDLQNLVLKLQNGELA